MIMKLLFNLEYHTIFGEQLVLNILDENGSTSKHAMITYDGHNWVCELGWAGKSGTYIDYYYSVVRGEETVRNEWLTVPHRLEYVDTVDGVRYINDSKATNVDACWYALESVNEPCVLILGGIDKGNDYSQIEPLVKQKVTAIVCLGVDNAKLHEFFDGKVPVVADARSMPECMDKCRELAHEGHTVLLSPCCASFDLFNGMADRGNQFKECVKKIKAQQ